MGDNMNRNILDIPGYINIEEVKRNSKYMGMYLNENIIEELRHLYTYNYDDFDKVLKELQLRGVGFIKEYQNNFLKKVNYKIDEIIKVQNDENRLSKIDFTSFGLGDFIHDFFVEGDLFFNYIPLNGFYSLIPSFKRELFRKTLVDAGFLIIHKDTLEQNAKDDDIYDSKNINVVKVNSVEVTDELSMLSNSFKYYFEKFEKESNYIDFLDNYFSEKNLLKTQPYELFIDEIEMKMRDICDEPDEIQKARKIELHKLQSHDVYNDIKNIPVNLFLNFFSKVNIYDGESKDISKLSYDFIDSIIVKKILKIINNHYSIRNIFDNLLNNLKENEKLILILRSQGMTLQSTGEKVGVTRERIRQIENKVIKNIEENREYIFLKNILSIFLQRYLKLDFIFFEKLGFDKNTFTILVYLIERDNKFYYNNTRKVLFKKSKYEVYKDIVNNLTTNNIIIYKDMFNLNSEEEIDVIKGILHDKGYIFYDDKYIKSKLSIVERLEYLFREIIHLPVRNNERNFEMLKKMMKSYFNYEVTGNKRSLFTRLADTKNVILVDDNTYMYQDLNDIDSSFLKIVKENIDKKLEVYHYADPRKIFNENYELMEINEIISFKHLYSIIKYFFQDEYNVGYQNTLYIYKQNLKGKSAESQFLNEFTDKHIIDFEELRKKLGWKNYKLEQLIARLENFVVDSSKQIISIESIENEIHYSDLLSEIEKEFFKGYIFVDDLVFSLFEKQDLYNLLKKFYLVDTQALSSFIKKKFVKAKGNKLFLYLSGGSITGIESILLEEFKGIVAKVDINEFLINKGYAQSTSYLIVDRLISLDTFIPYERGFLKNTYYDSIELSTIDKLNDEIIKVFEMKNIITQNEIDKVISELEYDMTTYMFVYIASHLGYKLIEAYDGSKYEIPIILRKESLLKDYDEVVFKVIEEFYDGDFSTKELIRFLKQLGLMSVNGTEIYLKLKESSLFEFDNFDVFMLIRS